MNKPESVLENKRLTVLLDFKIKNKSHSLGSEILTW